MNQGWRQILVVVLLAASLIPAAGANPSQPSGDNEWYSAQYTDDSWDDVDDATLIRCGVGVGVGACGTVLSLPFVFPFHGEYHTTVFVSSTGLISFDGLNLSPLNSIEALAQNKAIAVAWGMAPSAEVGFFMSDEFVYLGFRLCTVQAPLEPCSDTGAAFLYPDGTVRLQFSPTVSMDSATVGLSAGDEQNMYVAYDGALEGPIPGVHFNHVDIRPYIEVTGAVLSLDPGCEGQDTLCITVDVNVSVASLHVLGFLSTPPVTVPLQNQTVLVDFSAGTNEVKNNTGLRPVRLDENGLTVHPSPYGFNVSWDDQGVVVGPQGFHIEGGSANFTCEEGLVVEIGRISGTGAVPFGIGPVGFQEPADLAQERCRLMAPFLEPFTVPVPP